MGRRAEAPITPDVLRWAVEESGFSVGEMSKAAGVQPIEFEAWLQGAIRPSIVQARRVAHKLHRQLAVFLLPSPPQERKVAIEFRHPLGQPGRPLNAQERRYLRRARRLQEAQVWLIRELERGPANLPTVSVADDPEGTAHTLRHRLPVTMSDRRRWKSSSEAFDHWRQALESLGITIVMFPMGPKSCRGFSLWSDVAPLIAVNSAWRDEARIFTVFHEFGHLITRTNSACSEAPATPESRDPLERWCEEFGAAILMPRDAIRLPARVTDLATLSRLARELKVSLRAMAIRLIGLGHAGWDLYRTIPPASDAKPRGGGGTGRNRREIRQDEIGWRGTELFVAAVQHDIISESQALDYLDIPAAEFERLRSLTPTSA